MRIRITKSDPQSWYNEVIGNEFEAWETNALEGVFFISDNYFILQSDAVIIQQTENEKRRKIKTN